MLWLLDVGSIIFVTFELIRADVLDAPIIALAMCRVGPMFAWSAAEHETVALVVVRARGL